MTENQIQSFRKLTDQIINEYFEDEKFVYEMYANSEIQKLTQGKNILLNEMAGATFEAGDSIEEVMSFIKALKGSFDSIEKMIKLFREKPSDTSTKEQVESQTWEEKLIEAGLNEDKAKEITSKFKGQLISIIYQTN